MPTYKEGYALAKAALRYLLLPDDCMAMQVVPFSIGQAAVGGNVIAVHYHLPDVVQKSSLLQNKSVVFTQPEFRSDRIGDLSYAQAMGMRIPLERVDLRRKFEQLFIELRTGFRGTYHRGAETEKVYQSE